MMMMVILWQQHLPSSDLTTTRLTSNPEKISCLWDDGEWESCLWEAKRYKVPKIDSWPDIISVKRHTTTSQVCFKISHSWLQSRGKALSSQQPIRCYPSFFLDPLHIFFRNFDLTRARHYPLTCPPITIPVSSPHFQLSCCPPWSLPTTYLPTLHLFSGKWCSCAKQIIVTNADFTISPNVLIISQCSKILLYIVSLPLSHIVALSRS